MSFKLSSHVDRFISYPRYPKRLGAFIACLFLLGFIALSSSSPRSIRIDSATSQWSSGAALDLPSPPTAVLDENIPYLRDARRPGKVIASPERLIDVTDSFENFTRYPGCNTSSLELHEPFAPLCADKKSMLLAMSGGGRSGIDMPFIPRGCDMRWFNTEEICGILSRFSRITVAGDSMMRNLALAFHLLIRKDMRNGPTQSWNPDKREHDCHCHGAFENGKCWLRGAWSSGAVRKNDPDSMWCSEADTARIEYNVLLKYPLNKDADGLTKTLPKTKPEKPHVFVFGHGLWNNVNATASNLWLEEVQANINKTMPWVTESGAVHPRLFITPSCSGGGKPEKYLKTQGNPSLGRFELFMGPSAIAQGVDHLGVFNLTMQNTTPDGTHAGMHANIVKAMMVLNWLNMYDISDY